MQGFYNRKVMRKKFNITGSCNPEWHYMVDTEKRFKGVEAGLVSDISDALTDDIFNKAFVNW